MGYAVELCFDEKSKLKIKHLWEQLHTNHLSSYLINNGGEPHICLAVFDDNTQNIEYLRKVIVDFFKTTQRFELMLTNIGIFPTNFGISFIAPKVTKQLLNLHENFYEVLLENGYDRWFNEYYKPKNWIPHCTLTYNINRQKLLKSLELLTVLFTPFTATIEKISLIEFYPVADDVIKYIEVIELKNN
ncbi:2'-5' RNA ligase family protein [Clostridiaceae bacterium M8S5]|nr:2'-5' RNA ligase family protein [Clostridiaceae bacterium M8S5]